MNNCCIDYIDDIENLNKDDLNSCSSIYQEKTIIENSILNSSNLSNNDLINDDISKYFGCSCYLLKLDGIVIGLCITSKNPDWFNSISIYYLGITKAYRRKGFGKYLLKYVLDKNKNSHFTLMCFLKNKEALSLYKKFDFTDEITVLLHRNPEKKKSNFDNQKEIKKG